MPIFRGAEHSDSAFARTARPVLEAAASRMQAEAVSLILTDPEGVVLFRWCGDPTLTGKLDGVHLAPGFVYSEAGVGTNGIGTALETRSAFLVDGPEHFCEELNRFACAGAPVVHPLHGTVLGVVDITGRAGKGTPLMLSHAQLIADQIQEEILRISASSEIALLRDYLSACQHSGGSVMALGEDLVMLNRRAQESFDVDDRAALISCTADAAGSQRPLTIVGDLPSGIQTRIDYRPTFVGEALVGGIYRIAPTRLRAPGAATVAERVRVPGVVGKSTTMQRALSSAMASARRREPLLLVGEPGVGKTQVAAAVHRASHIGQRLITLSGDEAGPQASPDQVAEWLDLLGRELDEPGATVLVRRLDRLGEDALAGMADLLLDRSAAEGGAWLVATLAADHDRPQIEAQLLPHFARVVVVPPLRHRIADLDDLVPLLLARLTHAEVTVSPAAMSHLKRMPWPGNVEQVRVMLRDIVRIRRAGSIQVSDLPGEFRATTRRQLSPLEAMERDAIASALDGHGGNKEAAAASLGMSRATIYRRIKEYGITS